MINDIKIKEILKNYIGNIYRLNELIQTNLLSINDLLKENQTKKKDLQRKT